MIAFDREQLFLVTGASSGMGRATAQLLVRLGASVVATGRNEERLWAAKAKSACPEAFHVHARDLLRTPEGVHGWVRELSKIHGKFAGLACCAGAMCMDSLRNYDTRRADEVFTLHLHIPLLLAAAVTDRRNCVGPGTSLVFVAALGGVTPQAGLLSYGSAKAALVLAARNLSKELGGRKMRVNCISPALVRTPMTEKGYAALMGYDVLAAEEANYPLGIGQPEDVAHVAVFLLSAQARWISGQNIILDGGRY